MVRNFGGDIDTKKFYETIFDIEMYPMDMPDLKMVVFPSTGDKSGGALAQSQYHQPSMAGSLIYLNANPDLQLVLDRIDNAVGKILMPKTQVSPEIGFMAMFSDTEGNMLAYIRRVSKLYVFVYNKQLNKIYNMTEDIGQRHLGN